MIPLWQLAVTLVPPDEKQGGRWLLWLLSPGSAARESLEDGAQYPLVWAIGCLAGVTVGVVLKDCYERQVWLAVCVYLLR